MNTSAERRASLKALKPSGPRRYAVGLTCLALGMAAGCADDTEPVPLSNGLNIVVAPLSSEGCVASPNGERDFPPGVEKVVINVSGAGGFTATIQRDELDASGRVLVPGVPPGEELTLDLYGCDSTDALTWSGRVTGLTVKANDKVAPRIYFTKKGEMSCTGAADADAGDLSSELTAPRMLHSTATAAGDVFIVGGFDTYAPTPAPPTVSATRNDIVRYDASRGAFRSLDAKLTSPRAMAHTLTLGAGSHILVVGGVRQAEFANAVPVEWAAGQAADPAVEAIDVEAETVSVVGLALDNRAYSAAAVDETGRTIAVLGGRDANGQPSAAVQFVTGDPSAIVGGTATVESGTMGFERMGASAHFLPNGGGLLVIGGSANDDAAAVAEVLTDASTATPVTVTGTAPGSFALHASARLATDGCRHVFVVAGGVGLQRADPNPPLFLSPSASDARLHVMHVDVCDASAPTARFEDETSTLPGTARVRRIFHQLLRLGDGTLMLSGGYNQVGQPQPPVDQDCDANTLTTGCWLGDVSILRSEGAFDSLTLSERTRGQMSAARFGHRTSLLQDGSVLFTGGMLEISADVNAISSAAELFNPLLPADETRCQ